MALTPQSIRSTTKIYLNNKLAEKEEILTLSETFTENQENLFRKMMQQGGEFYIKDNFFRIYPKMKVLNSKNEPERKGPLSPAADQRF